MSAPRSGERLRGRRIVVTRPTAQNERLAALIRAEGGEPVLFPVIDIVELDDLRALAAAVDRLDSYDFAVFISPNAVDKAMNVVRARREWPRGLRAVTIGRGGEQALARHGVVNVIAPSGRFDSETLLAMPELGGVAGKRVVVFRGDGGRELLGDTLRERGATVDYVECYRRLRPSADAKPLLRAWSRGEIDGVVITSSEGVHNLFDIVGEPGQVWLKRTPIFAPHARIVETARTLGCDRVVETAPGDDGIAAALTAFWAKM